MNIALKNGDKVGIIGGGPSGSFSAIHLLKIANSLKIKLEISIFEKKDFLSGSGCNYCAGILSNNLIKELIQYNIKMPQEIIQREINGYYYETTEGTAYFPKPPSSKIYSIFRGNGPCISEELYNISFDHFLLGEALKMGARKIESNIDKIIFSSSSNDRVLLFSQEKDEYFEFDLVIGAFGINTPFTDKIEKSIIDYRAPQHLHSCQSEIPYDFKMNNKFNENIIIFLVPFKGLYFFSFTPKEKYLTVTVIGPHITKTVLEEIFTIPQVKNHFPDKWQFPLKYCHCHPRIPVTIAKNFFYNRFVIVGDACWSRYLKDGITSAFYTSKLGVECAFKYGISNSAFRTGYLKKIIKMDRDNIAGKFLFEIHNKFNRSQVVRTSLFSMTTNQSHKKAHENTRYILWGLFTGDYSYKEIMKKAISISFIVYFIMNIITVYLKIILNNLTKINKQP